jgi:Ca-activated chloride channel homolog
MHFVWPQLLALLLVVPLLVVLYLRLMKRRTARLAELAAKGFTPNAAALKLGKRRHVPFAFFLLGLTLLVGSLARPQTTVSVPKREGTIILAFDVSNSMRADDLKPTRMEAAKVAARAFIAKQPSNIKLGVVALSDGSLITQQPTFDREPVLNAVNRLTAQGATSLGRGLLTALGAIAGKPIKYNGSDDPNAATSDTTTAGAPSETTSDTTPPAEGTPNIDAEALGGDDGIDIGYFGSAAIVLLSDGENTATPDPLEVAKLSSTAGVKIYAVGVGSETETVIDVGGFKVATALDEEMLQGIAKFSDGAYFRADSADTLSKIYSSIKLEWKSTPQRTEVTALAAALSALALTIGSLLSLLWFGRLV